MKRHLIRIGVLLFIALWSVLTIAGEDTAGRWGFTAGYALSWILIAVVLTAPIWGAIIWHHRRARPK